MFAPSIVIGIDIPFYRSFDGPSVLSALACAAGDFPGFDRVWLSLSDGALIGPGTAIAGTYTFADREFYFRTSNATQRVIYPRCSILTEIENVDDMLNPDLHSVQLGIGPGSPLMDLYGSIDIVGGQLILGNPEEVFVHQFCLPDSVVSVSYYRDPNAASASSLRITPLVTVMLNGDQDTPDPLTHQAILTSDQESGFDIPDVLYNQIVDVISAESMYVDDEGNFIQFANCDRIRALLPHIHLVFTAYGIISLAPDDYTEITDGDLCSLHLKSVPINMPILINPFR